VVVFSSNQDEFGAGHLGEVPQGFGADRPGSGRCGAGPPAVSQDSAEVPSDGAGFQTARATGSLGSGSSGATTSTWLATNRKRSPRSTIADHPRRGPGSASKTSRTGSLAAADAERVDLRLRLGARDGRADLEHVRTEDLLLAPGRSGMCSPPMNEVPRPVAGTHRLHGGQQGRRLPVALAAEAVAVGHQPLDGQAGQLAQGRRDPRSWW